jgi:hypothetical protein
MYNTTPDVELTLFKATISAGTPFATIFVLLTPNTPGIKGESTPTQNRWNRTPNAGRIKVRKATFKKLRWKLAETISTKLLGGAI